MAKVNLAKSSNLNTILKFVAWILFIFGMVVIFGVSINPETAPTVPPSPLDIFWPALFILLPVLWLKKLNGNSKGKRFLSSDGVIVTLAAVSVVLSAWGAYRGAQSYFVTQDELISQKFAAVNVVYQKRFDLVPNVAASAKALATQERAVINSITKARSLYLRSRSTNAKVGAINDFNRALLSVNVENYPNLKSDAGFLKLIQVLSDTENQLVTAQNDYNQQVTALNSQSRTFPYNFLAKHFIDQPIKNRLDQTIDFQTQNSQDLLKILKE